MAEEEIIQFTGVAELGDMEKDMVNKLSTEYYQKIKMMMKNITSLSLHVKPIDKGGKKQYEIKLKAMAPTHIIESNNAKERDKWDLSRALHKTFKDLLAEIRHKLRAETQKPKGYE